MEESQSAARIDPISLFPPQMREPVTGLTFLGYLTEKVEFCGHTFVLETIRPYLKYAISQALEPWRNTIKEPEIYAALHVGVALTSIDGKQDFCPPISDNVREFVEARLAWLTGPQGYWQPVIDYLMGVYLGMEQKVAEAILELHRLSQGSRVTSQPLPDSLTVQGHSSDETAGDTLPTEHSS